MVTVLLSVLLPVLLPVPAPAPYLRVDHKKQLSKMCKNLAFLMLIKAALLPRNLSSHLFIFIFIKVPVPEP
jgi:hypothetical protein